MKLNRCVAAIVLALTFIAAPRSARAGLIEVGDLNIINDLSNPSHGLRYLDMSYGDGQTMTQALLNARAVYANARFATPAEFDHLFAAAGLVYDGALKASDAFAPGPNAVISSGRNYDRGLLKNILGETLKNRTLILTQIPDGPGGNRDVLDLRRNKAKIGKAPRFESNQYYGWLMVSEGPPPSMMPEPSGLSLFSFGGLLLGGRRRRRRI